MCETALYATPADDLNTCLLQRHSDQSSPRQKPLPAGDFVMRVTTIAFLSSLAILPPHSLPLQISSFYFFYFFGSRALIYSFLPTVAAGPLVRSASLAVSLAPG